MNEYLLIASRDPYTHVSARRCFDLASTLAGEGNRVTLFLIQNGVFPARPSSGSADLTSLSQAGVRVLADDFSLRERGIAESELAAGVSPASIEVVIEALEEGARTLWH
jgi:sulfur relay (sulfurtransferase) complex TusBCD TusD component (DsrE family)